MWVYRIAPQLDKRLTMIAGCNYAEKQNNTQRKGKKELATHRLYASVRATWPVNPSLYAKGKRQGRCHSSHRCGLYQTRGRQAKEGGGGTPQKRVTSLLSYESSSACCNLECSSISPVPAPLQYPLPPRCSCRRQQCRSHPPSPLIKLHTHTHTKIEKQRPHETLRAPCPSALRKQNR